MKFKTVNTYTGYAEYSIEGINTIEADTLENAVASTNKSIVDMVKTNAINDGYSDDDLKHELQFFSSSMCFNDKLCGTSDYGEENSILVLHPDNKWFHKVDNWQTWDNVEWNNWVEFIRSLSI